MDTETPQMAKPTVDRNNVSVTPAKKDMNIWMIISIVLVIILLGGGAYLLGKSGSFSGQSSVPQQNVIQSKIQTTPTSTPMPTGSQVAPTNTTVPATSITKVNAGGFGSFPKYTIIIPQGWQQEVKTNNFQNLLTITNGNGQYQLQINQTSMDNGLCSYPGVTPEPGSQQYTTFVSLAINGDSNYYRRSKSQIPYPNGEDQYAICQENSASSYSFVTTFGSMLYMAPTNPEQQILLQMDQMVQSMQKQ
jgi:hypothetical protein